MASVSPFSSTRSRLALGVTKTLIYIICFRIELREQDSNLQPTPYIAPYVSKRDGLYHHRFSVRGASHSGIPRTVLPFGIVSEPSRQQCCRIALGGLGCCFPTSFMFGLPAIHLVFIPEFLREAA